MGVGCHLDMSGVGQEMQWFLLVPFGELSAAEDEAELPALGELGHEALLEGAGGGESVVDLDLFVGLDIRKMGRAPADGPAGRSESILLPFQFYRQRLETHHKHPSAPASWPSSSGG